MKKAKPEPAAPEEANYSFRLLNSRGEEQSGGAFSDLQEQIMEMTESCHAVKGEQFAAAVTAIHAVLQIPLLLDTMYHAGIRRERDIHQQTRETFMAFSVQIVNAITSSMTDDDVDQSINLATDFFRRQCDMMKQVSR